MNFEMRESVLSDESKVYDLILANDTPWPAPSETAALEAADVLNNVIEGFQLCAGDAQIQSLAMAIEKAIDSVIGES